MVIPNKFENKDLYALKPLKDESGEATALDFQRNMQRIFFNGIDAVILVADKLELELDCKKNISEQHDAIIQAMSSQAHPEWKDIIKEVLVEQVFKHMKSSSPKDVDKFYKAFNQKGFLHPGALGLQSCSGNDRGNGMLMIGTEGIEFSLNVYVKNNIIHMDEHTRLMEITEVLSIEAMNEKKIHDNLKTSNPDKSPLLELKSKMTMKIENGDLRYRHESLSIEIKNHEIRSLFDTRTLSRKIKNYGHFLFGSKDNQRFFSPKPTNNNNNNNNNNNDNDNDNAVNQSNIEHNEIDKGLSPRKQ